MSEAEDKESAAAVFEKDSDRPSRVRAMLEMIRFSHTIFALPFAALAAVMAWKAPLPGGANVQVTFVHGVALLVCMVCARSVAMAFNRLVDQEIDGANPRTSRRHLPAGILSRREVWVFVAACSGGFLVGCAMFLPNWLPLAAAIPVLAFLCGYSLAKRFTWGAHLWLGVALSLAPICVWAALRGSAVIESPSDLVPAVLLAAAVALWVTGFDIIYACQDEAFDREAGLHSVPARFGARGSFRIAAACHFAMVVTLLVLPSASPALGLGWIYYAAVAAIFVLLCYEHSLVRPDDLDRINAAFFQVNSVVSVVLLVAGAFDCWMG